MTEQLMDKVERTIREERLLAPQCAVVAAVSGGPDSTALLHMLHRLSHTWGFRLIAAHVNHQFRGPESDREAEQVAKFAAELGLPFEAVEIDVPAYIRSRSLNPQEAAREKRYEFLLDVANRHRAEHIALAHHADDQAETVLMRIIRGTGSSGLAGIPVQRTERGVKLVRPLLRVCKSELVEYCREQGLSYAQDSSNEQRKYFRNQIRLDALPYLRRYNPRLPQALNRLAAAARDDEEFMRSEARKRADQIVRMEAGRCDFSRKAFLEQPIALQRRLIKLILNYLALEEFSIEFVNLEHIRGSIARETPGTIKLDVGERIRLVREYDSVSLLHSARAEKAEEYAYALEAFPGERPIPQAGFKLRFDLIERGEADGPGMANMGRLEAVFDYDLLAHPLVVRNRRQGDRMEIKGLNGSKKVKNIFIDDKIEPSLRDRLPLIADRDGRILWIPGVRRSADALTRHTTQRILHLKLERF